jgi:hypothetical protein
MGSDAVDHLPEGREVGRAVGRGGRAHGEKNDLRVPDRRGGVGGESQAAGCGIPLDEFLEARLVDRNRPG